MTKEQAQFIDILRRFAAGKDALLPKDADLGALSKLGRIHNLSAVLCYALNRQILDGGFDDGEGAKKLQRLLFKTVIIQTERLSLFDALLDVISRHGIRVILMKGAVINRYYSDPTLRTFGDIDFLIDPENRHALDEIMLSLGYERTVCENTVWSYVKGNEKYEVHTALLPNREVLKGGVLDFIDSAFDNIISTNKENVFELEPNYHLAFCLLHTAKHMRATGAGARMYLDIALMSAKESKMDYNKVVAYAKQIGLYEFLGSTVALNKKWFGLAPNVSVPHPGADTLALMEEYVVSAGVFGYYDRNPAVARLRDGQRGRTPKSALLEYVFPSYSSMRRQYKYLNGRPLLLPAVWVQRWFDGIFLRRKKAGKIFKGMFTEGEAARQSEKMLQAIGIKDSVK